MNRDNIVYERFMNTGWVGLSRWKALRNWAEYIAKGRGSDSCGIDREWMDMVLVAREVLDEPR